MKAVEKKKKQRESKVRLTNEDLKNGKLAVAKGRMGRITLLLVIALSYSTVLYIR